MWWRVVAALVGLILAVAILIQMGRIEQRKNMESAVESRGIDSLQTDVDSVKDWTRP